MLIAGIAGVACLFAAFFLNASGRISAESFWYQWLNSLGGFLLAYFALMTNSPIFLALNSFWGMVGLWHMLRRFQEKQQ